MKKLDSPEGQSPGGGVAVAALSPLLINFHDFFQLFQIFQIFSSFTPLGGSGGPRSDLIRVPR